MSDELRVLEDWLAPLLASIGPSARRKLARDIARDLRRSQQTRISAQLNPDGSRYEPRKASLRHRKGSIRRGAMFTKIRRATHLRTEVSPDAAVIGFAGRIARIASVHQFGLRDRVRPGGPEVQYAARRLLGLTSVERDRVHEQTLRLLAEGFAAGG